ncbi:zinc finger domain-containing protein [Sarocladium implicatum]|nr:zinc finger domain-containing protein [Sarocladium implicatum]
MATAEPSQPSDSDPNNPFHALEHSDKLKLLFAKYPGLPQQLGRIHEATLPPKPAPGAKPGIPESLMQGAPKKDNWNHDMGIRNGKAALRRAKSARGEEGEGVREYYELVMHMMNEASNRDVASQFVQQRVAQEDNKLIERLLAQEKR